MSEWPTFSQMDGISIDGTVTHRCSECPDIGPCPRQIFTFRELSDEETKRAQLAYEDPCDVYWGSHGCRFERGHKELCECDCCECENHPDENSGCVAKPPYYGQITRFYGDHVTERGLAEL